MPSATTTMARARRVDTVALRRIRGLGVAFGQAGCALRGRAGAPAKVVRL